MAKSLAWYANKSVTNPNINDAHHAYLLTKSALGAGGNISTTDLESKVLTALGYTSGSISDRFRAFYAAKTGLPTTTCYSSLENAFYANNTYDFA